MNFWQTSAGSPSRYRRTGTPVVAGVAHNKLYRRKPRGFSFEAAPCRGWFPPDRRNNKSLFSYLCTSAEAGQQF
jgi:hypothetical protein